MSITYAAENNQAMDVIQSASTGYTDFTNKFMTLSFGIQSYVRIKTSGQHYFPVLASMEQTNSVSTGKTFYLVFADDEPGHDLMAESVLDIVFDDEIFNTGISHFRFTKNDLDQIPEFNFLKINHKL